MARTNGNPSKREGACGLDVAGLGAAKSVNAPACQRVRTSCPSMPATSCAGSRCDCGKSSTTAFRGGRGSLSEPPRPGKLPQHSSAPCSWTCGDTGTGGGEGGARADPDTHIPIEWPFEGVGQTALLLELQTPAEPSCVCGEGWREAATLLVCRLRELLCLFFHPPGRRLLLRLPLVPPPCLWWAACPAAHAAEA